MHELSLYVILLAGLSAVQAILLRWKPKSPGNAMRHHAARLFLAALSVAGLSAAAVSGIGITYESAALEAIAAWPWAWICGLLYQVSGANSLPMVILGKFEVFPSDLDESDVERTRGKIIGALERILIFTFIMTGTPGALTFLAAAKGLARFKMMEKRAWAEYILIGTLLSAIPSVFCALILKSLGAP